MRSGGIGCGVLRAAQGDDDLIAVEKEGGAGDEQVVLRCGRDLFGGADLDGVVEGDGEAADGGQRGIAEDSLDLITAARKVKIRVVVDEGRHVAEGEPPADGEARNHGDVDLDGAAGEGVDSGGFIGDFEAGLFRGGARDEIEGRSGVEHPTARARVDKDGNVDEAEGIFADLERERVAGLDGRGRVVLGQRQHLERHLDLVLLVGAELGVEAGVEGLVGLRQPWPSRPRRR